MNDIRAARTRQLTPEAELADLRLIWGLSYQVDYDTLSGEWKARHYSAGIQMITYDPLTLRTLIRDDWKQREDRRLRDVRPVSREPGGAHLERRGRVRRDRR